MDDREATRLPVLPDPGDDGAEGATCESRVGVTYEEAAIVAAIHRLRRRVDELRERLGAASGPERDRLASELEEIRGERAGLERRREEAFRRKMQMLGHLPGDVELL